MDATEAARMAEAIVDANAYMTLATAHEAFVLDEHDQRVAVELG
jgi:hypothetical protein